MSKHRLGTRPNTLTVAELGYANPRGKDHTDKPRTPNARETFAALGVMLFILCLIVGVGALIAFTAVHWAVV